MAENVEQTPPQKAKRSILHRLIRALLVIVIVLLLLGGLLISFTQTSSFRNIVRSQIEKLVEENTNGRLTLGRIEGNLLSGFTIYDVHLKLRGDSTELISMKELYAHYSIWKFLSGKEIPIATLTLRSPDIHFVKPEGDSLWNYERLFKTTKTAGPSSPFNLTVDIQNLRIESGQLVVIDHNGNRNDALHADPHSIDWSNYFLHDLDLDMRVHVEGEKIQRAQINNISFATEGRDHTPFILRHLELSAYRNDLHTEITGLHLISNGSDIRLTAIFDPLNVLNGAPLDSLAHSKVNLHLSGNSVSEKELRQFLPDLSFLEGRPEIDLDADGEFGKLKIKRGRLGFHSDGEIAFTGELRNLHDPSHLYLDVLLKGRTISDRTLRNYVPGLEIPDMQRFGIVNIDKLTFTGYTDNFASNFDIHTAGGNVEGKAALDLRSKEMVYDAAFSTTGINLARLLNDSTVKSVLNSTFTIKGRGTDLKTMQAQFTLDGAGTTEFKHYQLEKLHLGGKIGSGKLELENTDIVLHSGATLHSDFASLDFSRETPFYDFDVATKELAVTDFAPFFPATSRVSVNANLSGSGTSPNNITGSIHAEISGLMQDKKPLPNIKLEAALERDESGRRVDIITSSIADLTFKGKYNIETIGGVFADRIKAISLAIKDRGRTDVPANGKTYLSCSDSINFSYAMNMKDLRPIAPFIPAIIFLGSGKLNGSVIGCENGPIALTIDGNIHNFFMRQRSRNPDSARLPLLRLRDTKFSFSGSGISPDQRTVLQSLHSEFQLQTDSILKFTNLVFEKPRVNLSLNGGNLQYQVNTAMARSLGIYLSGTGSIAHPSLSFQTDSLSLAFGNSFIWHTDKPSQITFGEDGSVQLDTLSLIRPKPGFDPENRFAQRVKLGFKMKGDSIDYAFISTPQIDVIDIPKFFSEWTTVSELSEMKGRINKLDAVLRGSLSHPLVSAEVGLKNFTYRDVTIDSGKMNLLYKDLTLSGKALFHVDTAAFAIDNILQGRENFIVSGNNSFRLDIDSVPLLFSLQKYPGYAADSVKVSGRTISIRASGKDYPMDMFSPFIPVISRLHGLADIELTVGGTLRDIIYKGSVDIRKGSFVLPTTNMQYMFDGKMLLTNDEMKFIDINLTNMPGDDPEGRAVMNGSLYFKGFEVERFGLSLSAPNRISILSEDSRQTLKTIYGPLAIRTLDNPLTFSGEFGSPKLSGHIFIVQGFLTMPQSDAASTNVLNDGITYRIKHEDEPIDTLRQAALIDSIRHLLNGGIAAADSSTQYNDKAFEEATHTGTTAPPKPQFTAAELSFQDKMLYDLQISSAGNLWFALKLSKLYGAVPQSLTAEIRTDGIFTYSREEPGTRPVVSGKIVVTDKSSYSFIKDFSPVTGSITFSNNLDNPALDITAEYTGEHTTSNGSDETIKIKLIIAGERNDPRLTMEIYRKNIQGEYIKDSRAQDEVKADVLTYLTSGFFASDDQSKIGGGGTIAQTSYAAGSQILNAAINNYLSSTFLKDYVRSIGVEYGGSQSFTKVKAIVGYKDLRLSYAGIFSGTGGVNSSNDFSLEIPFSTFANFPNAQNFLFRGETHLANSSSLNSQGLTQPPIFLGRFLFRIIP